MEWCLDLSNNVNIPITTAKFSLLRKLNFILGQAMGISKILIKKISGFLSFLSLFFNFLARLRPVGLKNYHFKPYTTAAWHSACSNLREKNEWTRTRQNEGKTSKAARVSSLKKSMNQSRPITAGIKVGRVGDTRGRKEYGSMRVRMVAVASISVR